MRAQGDPDVPNLAERHRRGRPRSLDCDRAIEAAALELLVEEGLSGMTIEGVAGRAGVGKATIYRRWPAKEDLVLDAVVHRCQESVVSPDTGTLRGDLLEMYRATIRKFQRDGRVMWAFAAERGRNPELAEAFRAVFLEERRTAARRVFARGVDRGELPAGADLDLLVEVGPALLWHRLSLNEGPIKEELAERIVDQFFSAAGS